MGLEYLNMVSSGKTNFAIQTWARNVIVEAATTEGELDSFLDIVVNIVASAMNADSCGIYLKDENKMTLTQRAGIGSQSPRYNIRSYRIPTDEQIKSLNEKTGLTAWIAATCKSFYAKNFNELSKHPHHRGAFDAWNFPHETNSVCGAFLGVPLHISGTTIGVIKVENISKKDEIDNREFSVEAQRRFDILAQDIALTIIRLQEQSHTRYQVINDALPTITEILRGSLDVLELVKRVVAETAKLFNARACALFLKVGDRLIQPNDAAYGWAQKGPKEREYTLVDPAVIEDIPTSENKKVGLTVWIAAKQKKFIAKSNLELKMHPHHKGTFDKDNFDEGQKCESFMGVPLLARGELIGVLKVETKMRKTNVGTEEFTYFTEQDELVFDLIANSIANTIQYLEARRSLEANMVGEIFRLTLIAFAHRGRGVLSMTKHLFDDEKVRICDLDEPNTCFPIESRKSISKLLHKAERSIDSLNDLYSQYEKWFGRGDIKERTNISEIVNSAIEETKQDKPEDKSISVTFDIKKDLPKVFVNTSIVRYVIHELLRNAIKSGATKISIRGTVSASNYTTLIITDNGPGLSSQLKEAFDQKRLIRSENATEGGLGLLLSRYLIEWEKGQFKLLSEQSQEKNLGGACFAILLPSDQSQDLLHGER